MRVLEVSGDAGGAAAWCGQLFVRAGAVVVAVQLAGTDLHRTRADDLYLDDGKTVGGVVEGDALGSLVDGVDIVVTDASPARVAEFDLLNLAAPVVVSITPYGLSGPYRDWHATASTLLAHGAHTYVMGDRDRPPLTMPGRYPYYQAGNFAFCGAAAVLLGGGGSGPARLEVSVLECLSSVHQFTDTMYTDAGRVRRRRGNRWANLHPITLLPCADGWFAVNILDNFWESFAQMIGRPDLTGDHPWARNPGRFREPDEVEEAIVAALGSWPKEKIFLEGQGTWRVPIGHLQSLGEILDDPHLESRDFWTPRDNYVLPGTPYRITPTKNLESFTDGFRQHSTPGSRSLPLQGLRVLELAHFWSAPLCGRTLGDLGADVVKVEARNTRGGFSIAGLAADPDTPPGLWPWNKDALFGKLNRNKRGLAIDLKSDEGREAFLKLVDTADVLIENYSARALPGLGLGHEVLRARNPGLVYVAMPGFGLSGPYREYVALGPSTEPMTGLTALMGYGDDEPRVTSKAILDPMSGMIAVVAVLDALLRRQLTGTGCLVEVSQHECGLLFVGEQLVERQLTGTEPARTGNQNPAFALHDVLRCAGEDEWIAVAARDDAQHTAFLDVLAGRPTEQFDKFDLAAKLQSRGVAAAPVVSTPEWLADPQLDGRGYFTEIADADREPRRGDGMPILFDGERAYDRWRRAPMLGEHNAHVLAEAGLDAATVAVLATEGVIADRPVP